MDEAQVDIIIPVFDQAGLTKACIDSIKEHSDVSYNLILIDNGSGDETRKFLEGLGSSGQNVTLVRNDHNLGWVKAVNQGMRLSKSGYVIFMNNDTVVRTDRWLSGLVGVAEMGLDIGLVNPRFEIKKKIATTEPFIEIDFCRGYCVLVKRAVIEKIGFLDESYGLGYYDDDDYSVRACRAGFRCVRANGVFVEHLGDSTFTRMFEEGTRRALHEKNKKLFYSKWGRRLKLVFAMTKEADGRVLPDTLLRLARKQHIVYVWGMGRFLPFQHINVRESVFPGLFRNLLFALALFSNSMKKGPKRYDIVFVDDERLKSRLSGRGYNIYCVDMERDGGRIDEVVDKAAGV